MDLTQDQRDKILTPAVQRLLDVLDADARVVGGAVRDALLGRVVCDIDLASPLPPERVMEVLAIAGIKAVPTGIAHGTVTAVLDGAGYEITTLRRDVETYGRHAKVEYTDDWVEDASRRDFTMNALSVDEDGNLYDYFGGAEDAKVGRVTFIGDAHQRIQEDVLRILRYFRFFAFFGSDGPDAQAVAACRDLAALIPTLSVERITKEFLKLLTAANPIPALRLMVECGVLVAFLPEVVSLARLEKLLKTERTSQRVEPVSIVRLAALLPENADDARAVAARLKLSNKDAERLVTLSTLPKLLAEAKTANALHRLLYAFGTENCRAAALLNGAALKVMEEISTWKIPSFPLRGEDIVRLGCAVGPKVGEIMREAETWWMDNDFMPTRQECLEQAKALLSK